MKEFENMSIGPERIRIHKLDICNLKQIAEIHSAAFPENSFSKLGFETVRRYYNWQFEGPHDLVVLGAF